MQLALTTLKKPQLALGICRCCDRYLRHLVHESKQPINTLGTQGQGVLNGELVDTLASTPTPTPMPPTILLSLHAGRDPSRSSAPRPTHARTSTTHHHESPMIEHGSPPTVHPPFPYNFGQTTRRQSSVPRGLGTLENMDDFSFEQAMAEFDDFYGPSIASSSPAALDGNINKHIGLKRISSGDAMLLDAPPPPVTGASAPTATFEDGARKSPELAELHKNPWADDSQESAELALSTAIPIATEDENLKLDSPMPQPTDISFLIHTTPPPSDLEQAMLVTHAEDTSAFSRTLQHPPPSMTHDEDVPKDSPQDPDIYGDTSTLIVADNAVEEPQAELSQSSRSPSSPTTSQEDRPRLTPADEVHEHPDAYLPFESELPAMGGRPGSRGPERKMREATDIHMPIDTESLAADEPFESQEPAKAMQETPKIPMPVQTESHGPRERPMSSQAQNVDVSNSAILQSPQYVPSSMISQAVSEFLPQQATPVAPSSSQRSELHAEMRAEEDAASAPIRPAPVSAFSDRLNSTPAQPSHADEASDWSLDKYGNIVFEDDESGDEYHDPQPKPKGASTEDSAIEVAKAPRPKRMQPSRIRPDPARPHWAQLKKPAPKKLPSRIKKVPVQTRLPSRSPSASGSKSAPPSQSRNGSTRSSVAAIAETRPTRGIKLEEPDSSITETASDRSPSPPMGAGAGMPNGYRTVPPLSQPVHAPSARLQLANKPKHQAVKKRPRPLNNLVASMVPPEFDNTGGSFVEPREQDKEIIMDGATSPPSPKRKGAAKASKKRPYAGDETVYDEEGNLVMFPAPAPDPAPAPAPAPKRMKPDHPKKRIPTKAPVSKELMSIVGASVMADMNSPRKTRKQQREMDATAPNASAAAKRRHTKPGKLIA